MPVKPSQRLANLVESLNAAAAEGNDPAVRWYGSEIIMLGRRLDVVVECLREARDELANLGKESARAFRDGLYTASEDADEEISRIQIRIDAALARVDGNSGE